MNEKDTLTGLIDSIVYRNEENGYTVTIVEDSDGFPVTAVGIMPYLNEGDRLSAIGTWTTHKVYGRQFSVESFDRHLPAEEGDILRYLASGSVKGIGPKTAQKIVEKFGYTADDVKNFRLKGLEKTADIYGMAKIAQELSAGEPTVRDIIKELEKPGRDIREDLPMPELRSDILDMNDLQGGMILNGVVRNVIDFGAFVDIGVHQDGLVHVSEICKKFIKHPSEALSVGDHVRVKIKSIDKNKGRIGLTMKDI